MSLFLVGLSAPGAGARADTTAQAGTPVVELRDSSMHPGTSSIHVTDSGAVVRYGPEPSNSGGWGEPTTPASGWASPFAVLWIVGIATAIFSAIIAFVATRKKQRARVGLWEQRSERREPPAR